MLTTNSLEDALARGRAGDISLDDVLATLADTELYLPIDDSTSFRRRMTDDGRPFVPAFATLDELRHAEPDAPYLVAAGRDLAADWESELWMYLNPEGRTPLMLRSDKISALAAVPLPPAESAPAAVAPAPAVAPPAQSSPDTVPSGWAPLRTDGVLVSVQAPRTPPPAELVAAIRTVAATNAEVAEAYLFEAYDDGRGARLVAGLVPAAGRSVRELAGAVAAVHRQLPGVPIEVMAIDAALRDVVASSVPQLT